MASMSAWTPSSPHAYLLTSRPGQPTDQLYDPPVKLARPFSADCPRGAATDASGRPLTDIEGRSVRSEFVVGADEALTPAQLDAATQAGLGSAPEAVAAGALPTGTVGAYRVAPGAERTTRQIAVRRDLPAATKDRVVAHEVGHMVKELAGGIPIAGLNAELRQVYNTLNTGRERTRNLTGPQHAGYRGEEVGQELIAEAIRAYLTNPNYLKTVAPRTAAAIRKAVNEHPSLSRIIQFNSVAGAAAALGAALDEPEER